MPAAARAGLVAVFVLLLAACGADGADEAAQTAPVTPTPPTLDLEATGIVVPPQGGFEQFEVPFGSVRGATEATLANVVGDAVGREDARACPSGVLAVTSFEGLDLFFAEDSFVGWVARAPYVPELSRAEMLADPGVALVAGSRPDVEFTIGNRSGPIISGIFAGAEDGSAIEALWAGTICERP